ncbi:MAG: hypothetical protein R3F37_19335 [Candidatus Competibacteraceae bacterium]
MKSYKFQREVIEVINKLAREERFDLILTMTPPRSMPAIKSILPLKCSSAWVVDNRRAMMTLGEIVETMVVHTYTAVMQRLVSGGVATLQNAKAATALD